MHIELDEVASYKVTLAGFIQAFLPKKTDTTSNAKNFFEIKKGT